MKRRLKKVAQKEQQIAQRVFEEAKDFYSWDDQIINYTKRRLQERDYTIDGLKQDQYDANMFFKGILKQHLGIYDAISDEFFSDENGVDDVTNPNSKARAEIDSIIDESEDYGVNFSDLLNDENIIKKLSN